MDGALIPWALGLADDVWYWASAEPWGWATCRYGRWYTMNIMDGSDSRLRLVTGMGRVEWRRFLWLGATRTYAVFNIHSGIHYASLGNIGFIGHLSTNNMAAIA
jgi:hypothetical protein